MCSTRGQPSGMNLMPTSKAFACHLSDSIILCGWSCFWAINLNSVPTQKWLTMYKINFSSNVSLLNSISLLWTSLICPNSSWFIGLRFITFPMFKEKIQSVGSTTPKADRMLILNFFELFTDWIAAVLWNLIPVSMSVRDICFLNSDSILSVYNRCLCWMLVGSFTEYEATLSLEESRLVCKEVWGYF